jgi:ubiquinol-cytochrome c reductase cytochrome b subunit
MSASNPPRPRVSRPPARLSRLARVDAWLDERIGHRNLLHEALDEPIPGGARWAYVFGSALALVFAVQVVTGILLMTTYAPSATTAWASVHYITYKLSAGWLVRGLHHFGSQAMVVLLGAHLFQVAAFGAYRRPREMNWWLGLALMAVTLGFSLTGYLLPWDQKGYWATRVATNIAGTTPMIGAWLQQAIQGGADYGNLTLTRFYALHVGLFPALLVALLAMHVALFRKHGVTPAHGADLHVVDRFFPKQVWKDLVVTLIVVAVMFALAMREHGADLDAPAAPASDYPARPEWYFLPLFQMLKYFHGPLEVVGTMVVPAIAAAYLVFLPLIDRKPTSALRPRAFVLAPLALGGMGVVLLTWLAFRDDARDAAFRAARVKADARAKVATALAMNGVPAAGPLEMLARDPELRGEMLFAKSCAQCHVLGDLGDPKKATATTLDGWSTEAWILALLHDPDADAKFGKSPYVGIMPSMDTPPKDAKPDSPPFKAMSAEDKRAAAAFLASQGDEAGEAIDPKAARRDSEAVKKGEAIVTTRCTTCHLWKGEGDDSGTGVAPELSGYGSIAWVRAQVTNPATPATYGKDALDPKMKGHMPRFDQELAPEDIDLVARWVRAHARGTPLAAARN